MRTNKEMKATERNAKVDKGANVVFWLGVCGIIGLGLSTFFMQSCTQETCLYLGGFFACICGFIYVFK